MAASTLHTFLFKLGFDIAGLSSGGAAGRAELARLAAAAQATAQAAAPASAGIRGIGSAAQQTAGMLNPLITNLNAANASTGILLNTQGAQAMRMREAYQAAGPLVTTQQALVNANKAASASAGGLVTAQQASANAMRATAAAAGPLLTSSQQLVQAVGPLVAGIQGANGAMAAGAPAANLAAAGFVAAGRGANIAAGGVVMANNALMGTPGPALRAAMALKTVAAAEEQVASRATFMNRVLSMAFAFSGGVAVTTLFGFLANAVLGFNSRLEQAHIAFETLLGNADKGDAFIKQMQDFANVTPFNFQGVTESAQRLLAMGFTAEQVLPTLTAVGDAVAALGGDTEKLNRITIALGQMSTAGRVNAQDMRQLTEAGIPAWQMLADGIGKTVAQTRKMAEDGLIPASQALDILVNSMETKYAGMMARQARTLQGAFSTVRDMALITISASVEPLFNALSTAMVSLADFLLAGGGKFIAPAIQAIGVALAIALIPRLYGAAVAAAAATSSFFGLTVPILPLLIALTVLGTLWQENIGGMRTTFGPVIGQLAQLVRGILEAVSATGLMVPAIVAVAAAITAKFVVGLVASAVAMVANTAAAIGLRAALSTLTPAAAGAGVSMLGFSTAAGGAATAIAAWVLPITLIVAAITLLVMNFDRAAQGFRVLQVALISVQRAVYDLLGAIPGPQQNMFKGLSDNMTAAIESIKRDMASAEADINRKAAEMEAAGKGANPLEDFRVDFNNAAADLLNDTTTLVERFGSSLESVKNAYRFAGGESMAEMAKGIAAAADAPANAFKNAIEMSKTALSEQEQIARDIGILSSQALADGLRSNNPEVAAAWAAVQLAAVENLDRITKDAFSAGMNAGKGWLGAFREEQEKAGFTKVEIKSQIFAMNPGEIISASKAYFDLSQVWGAKFVPSAGAAAAAYAKLEAEIQSGTISITQAAAEMASKFSGSIDDIRAVAERAGDSAQDAGASFMAEYAQGLAQNVDAPLNAMKDLLAMQKAALDNGAQETRLVGILISKQLSDGLRSGIPSVVAQSIAVAKFIMNELNRLQPGAYAAGYGLIIALANGMISPAAFKALNQAAAAARLVIATSLLLKGAPGAADEFKSAMEGVKNAANLVIPSFGLARNAANDWFKTLDTGSAKAKTNFVSLVSEMKDKLKDAFGEVKRAARTFFDELHERNLKAISDAHDLAEAQLDAPANAFRSAINAERALRREAELRKALAEAKTPAEMMEAQQSLVDFLQDQELQRLEEAAEEAKRLNDLKEAEQRAAENKRYTAQVADFNRELAALQKHMLRHPEEWKRMQAAVLSLLAEHGISYIEAGALLGKNFADGLKKSVGKAVSAAEDLADAAAKAFNAKFSRDTATPKTKTPSGVPTPPPVPKQSAGQTGVAHLQTGMWKVMEDNMLAYLDRDEMVVPRELAGLLRTIAQGPITGGSRLSSTVAAPAASSFGASSTLSAPATSSGGKGTLIVMMDGRVVGSVADERIAVEEGLTVVLKPGTR